MYDYPELNHNVFCLTLDASTFFSQRQVITTNTNHHGYEAQLSNRMISLLFRHPPLIQDGTSS